MNAAPVPAGAERVWDRFVRVFHWSLVSCVLLDYFVIDDGKVLHQWIGYGAAALVVARIVWGFIGAGHARFADFFPTPARVRRHIVGIVTGKPEHHAGHNPLGALMILALMTLVLALGVTGWMQTLDAWWGVEWVQDLHEQAARALIVAASLHALAAIVMGRLERTRLIRAMFTGVKEHW